MQEELKKILKWDAEQTYNQNASLHEETTGNGAEIFSGPDAQLKDFRTPLVRSPSKELLRLQNAFLRPTVKYFSQLRHATDVYTDCATLDGKLPL